MIKVIDAIYIQLIFKLKNYSYHKKIYVKKTIDFY